LKYSIIIPVYNRLIQLECTLFCLAKQTFTDFEIIVCDDGSGDDTLGLVKKFQQLNIKYLWQQDRGFRAGQARNNGVKLARSETIVFIDSDVIVRDNWLATYEKLYTGFPDCVICGRYDFLLPMNVTVNEVAHEFDMVVSNRLPILRLPMNEMIGEDIRKDLFEKDKKKKGKKRIVHGSGGALFGGNALIPKYMLDEVGGFDEVIRGHGGEDSDLGQTLDEHGFGFIFTEEVMGWHIYHDRSQEDNWRTLEMNIRYIDKKHGRIK